MSKTISTFPAYAGWLREYCAAHAHPFIRDSSKMIDYCFEVDRNLPDNYHWRFSSEESLKIQVKGVSSSMDLNRIYWTDQARNIEAYSMTTFWRGVELLKPAIRGLNIREITGPAVLARSLLEIGCTFIMHANNLEKTLSELSFPANTVVASHEFEEMVVKMIWGTRYGDPEPHLKQTNVLSCIQKVAKNPNATDVLSTYEYLCDIAHPSFIGNTRFWSHVEELLADSSERRVISRYASGDTSMEILDKILWSLGWSAAVLRNGFEITRSGLEKLLDKINRANQGIQPTAE